MEVHKTKEMGWGVRAVETIPKGAYIADYCGEMITNSSCDDREDSCKSRDSWATLKSNHLFHQICSSSESLMVPSSTIRSMPSELADSRDSSIINATRI